MKKISLLPIAILFVLNVACSQNLINRKALVERHTISNNKFDSLSSLSVGNGKFAFTVDITGLQTFPDAYAKGVPLGTQTEWGWHSFINTANYVFEETLRDYDVHGRKVSYSVQIKEPERKVKAVEWFRQNPHRLHLGNVGFDIYKKDGSLAGINDIQNINQTLNMWSGEIHSQFTVENIPVDVITYSHQYLDAIGVKVSSALLKEGRILIRFKFPYPTGGWADMGNNYSNEDKHQSAFYKKDITGFIFEHKLDSAKYYGTVNCKGATVQQKEKHYFQITPPRSDSFQFTFQFAGKPEDLQHDLPYRVTKNNSIDRWKYYWETVGVVDLSGSTDERAKELERRIILSQYLTKLQCAGNNPPQETGLTYNSWYGRPHMEMHWWHAIHFSLWGRNDLMEKSLEWYAKAYEKGIQLAKRQGYEGVRWQKMTDNEGNESPSSVGAFLIWQQPHFIYFSELCYRDHKDVKTLEKYKNLVFATADFMASYAYYDSATQKYVLGPALIPAQERFKAETTINPAYELVYWQWALKTAQQWRQRLKLPRNKKWDQVLDKLAPLSVQDNKYLFTETGIDSYTNPEFKTDHPSVLGALGMLPQSNMVDASVMQNSFNWIWKNWSWEHTWGWDFPMTAMTATRLGMPEKAIDALLMPVEKNTYLNNGHNYQDKRLTIYLPGNGGLLAAVAMMCAGYDGCKTTNPGFPKNKKWKVKWEGLKPMP